MLGWALNLGFAGSGSQVQQPQQPVKSTDAGGRRTRFVYRLTWNGKQYQFSTYSQAVEFLELAKERARRTAIQMANRAVKLQRNTAVPVPLPKPTLPDIEAIPALKVAATQARKDIEVIYEKELINAEIRLLMELNKRQSDEEENIFWLM